MPYDAIIIGAGAAALAAARILSDAGCNILILEARPRMGGRIHTLHDSTLDVPIELGAEFIHGDPRPTWNLLRESGLLAYDLPFAHKQLRHGRMVDLGDINEALSPVMDGLPHIGKTDKSFAEYLRRHKGGSPEARKFAVSFVEGFDAADPEKISAKAIAQEQQGIGDVENETQFRPVKGYGALIDYLHQSLNPRRVELRLGAPVSEINWRKSHVEILAPSLRETPIAKRALITLPLGVLQLSPPARGTIRFNPDIPAWRRTAAGLAFGSVIKAVILFHEPFWEERKDLRDAVFLHDPPSKFPTWWTLRPLRAPILTAWAAGPKAAALAGSTRARIQHAAVASLSNLLKRPRRQIIKLIREFHCYDWSTDPFARGAYSYVAVGGMNAREKLSKPIDNTLFFAGEALDTSGQASTVAGAIASGQQTAHRLLKTFS